MNPSDYLEIQEAVEMMYSEEDLAALSDANSPERARYDRLCNDAMQDLRDRQVLEAAEHQSFHDMTDPLREPDWVVGLSDQEDGEFTGAVIARPVPDRSDEIDLDSDPEMKAIVAMYEPEKVEKLVKDPGLTDAELDEIEAFYRRSNEETLREMREKGLIRQEEEGSGTEE